jgi:hypothetical protein
VAVLLKLKMTFVVVPVAGLYVGAVDPAAIQPAKDQVNEARGNSAACSNTLGGGAAPDKAGKTKRHRGTEVVARPTGQKTHQGRASVAGKTIRGSLNNNEGQFGLTGSLLPQGRSEA